MILMNKIIEKSSIFNIYQEDINVEINKKCDVVIYHYIIDKDVNVNISLNAIGANVEYHCSHINYDNNKVNVSICHNSSDTISNIYNHGVNVNNRKLDFLINGIVRKDMNGSVCNQDNQIINIRNGKSTICPNLLIDNYDTSSRHSAYIGKFDMDKIFYLKSRGLSEKRAYQLLLKSFLIQNNKLDKKLDNIKDFLEEIYKI